MNLHIDFLKAFVAVADARGFASAGRTVNRSRSAVSIKIKRLEGGGGKPLNERIGKTAMLTIDDNLLPGCTRRIVNEHEDAVMGLSKPGCDRK